jgi:hypothetical protein
LQRMVVAAKVEEESGRRPRAYVFMSCLHRETVGRGLVIGRPWYHIDQNPYISSLCPKLGVVSVKMTWGDDVAKSTGPTDPRWGRLAPLLGRPARVWRQ